VTRVSPDVLGDVRGHGITSVRKIADELNRKLEFDLSSGPVGHPAGVRTDQAKRERDADALLGQSNQIVTSQTPPRLPATYCSWLGNTLNCASLRQSEAGGQSR
jgi:hypothetical protein